MFFGGGFSINYRAQCQVYAHTAPGIGIQLVLNQGSKTLGLESFGLVKINLGIHIHKQYIFDLGSTVIIEKVVEIGPVFGLHVMDQIGIDVLFFCWA